MLVRRHVKADRQLGALNEKSIETFWECGLKLLAYDAIQYILQLYKIALVILEKSDLVNWFNHSSHSGALQIKPKEQAESELGDEREKT